MKKVIKISAEKKFTLHPELVHKSHLLIHTKLGIFPVAKKDIIYLKSDGNYCEIHLVDGRKICCSKTLKYISSKLNRPHFIRVHNSYVVNVKYITCIDPSYTQVEVSSVHKIPISRSRQEMFKAHLQLYFD